MKALLILVQLILLLSQQNFGYGSEGSSGGDSGKGGRVGFTLGAFGELPFSSASASLVYQINPYLRVNISAGGTGPEVWNSTIKPLTYGLAYLLAWVFTVGQGVNSFNYDTWLPGDFLANYTNSSFSFGGKLMLPNSSGITPYLAVNLAKIWNIGPAWGLGQTNYLIPFTQIGYEKGTAWGRPGANLSFCPPDMVKLTPVFICGVGVTYTAFLF